MNNQKKAAAAATNAITEGIIWRQLLIFFFPIVLGTFFQQLYNTADAMIVGRFVGKEALAAVGGSSNQIINLIIGFFVGVSSGATCDHRPALWFEKKPNCPMHCTLRLLSRPYPVFFSWALAISWHPRFLA